MFLPEDVKFIISTLNNSGYEAYAVGGCVRDSLLGLMPIDFDITTSAEPSEIKKLFSRTVDTGIAHGTVTVLVSGKPFEVTTYRIDGEYTDNRHPSTVTFTDKLELDLMRRDFTVNAMAYHPDTGIRDPFNGKTDMAGRLIRGVGNPEERFEEDGLRMLRAIRFAARLGFEIEKQTLTAIYKKAYLIQNISFERIRDEFLKIIISPYPNLLQCLTETLLCGYFSGSLQEYLNKYYEAIILLLLKSEKDPVICLTQFFRYSDITFAKNILKLLRFDNKTIDQVLVLLPYINKDLPTDSYGIRKLLSQIGEASFYKLVEINEGCKLTKEKAAAIINNADCLSLKNLAVNGTDLKELGYNGQEIGHILQNLLEHVLKDPSTNQKELLLKLALPCKFSHFGSSS